MNAFVTLVLSSIVAIGFQLVGLSIGIDFLAKIMNLF